MGPFPCSRRLEMSSIQIHPCFFHCSTPGEEFIQGDQQNCDVLLIEPLNAVGGVMMRRSARRGFLKHKSNSQSYTAGAGALLPQACSLLKILQQLLLYLKT